MIGFLAAGALAPFFFEAAPEVRTTYVSLGSIVEDRPMQTAFARAGYDTGDFGRFSIRFWDVSSLTGRRQDVHRRAFYHVEFGPAWQYTFNIADEWRVASEFTRCWTFYNGFENQLSNRSYHWYQFDQSLENPYVVPFYFLRRCFRGTRYTYFRVGARRRCPLVGGLYVTPSVFADGGSSRNGKRVLGDKPGGGNWSTGVTSVSFRLELGWKFCESLTAFAFVEQYEIVGGDARRANDERDFRCAHNDWTLGGVGMRFRF